MKHFILLFILNLRKKGRAFFWGSGVLALIWGCVAKSGSEFRFQDSASLSLPSFSIEGVSSGSFSFSFVGDIHLGGSDTQRLRTVLEAAKNHGDAFVIFLGDLVDKGDRESLIAFRSQISEFGFENKSLYVLGNHDVFDNGWVHWRELMGPSHFDILIGNCHFFVLDSADGIVGEKQSQWLEAKLKNSTSAHKIVLSHYMPLVPGQRTYLRLADELEAVSLMKLLTRYEATAWLGGHYHSFVQEKIENVTYLVAGGGGGRRMEPIKDNFFVRAQVTADKISFELIKF